MLIPPLFLLSLVVAQPVSAAPLESAAAVALPWGASRANGTPGAPGIDIADDLLLEDGAFDPRWADSAQTPPSEAGTASLFSDLGRRDSTGSASSLPRVVGDLLSRLLDLVRPAPLPLPR